MTSASYDAAGNRCIVTVDFNNLHTSIANQFDKANRMIVDGGAQRSYVYDKGFRVQEFQNQQLYRELSYDDDGKLTQAEYHVSAQDTQFTVNRQYGLNNQLVEYTESDSTSTFYTHQIVQNTNGWQLKDTQHRDDSLLCETTYDQFTQLGLPQHQYTSYPNDIDDDMKSSFVGYDDQKLASIGGQRHDQYGWGRFSVATQLYDANGMVTVMGGLDDSGASDWVLAINARAFLTTPEGVILQKYNSGCFYPERYGHLISQPGGALGLCGHTVTSSYFYNTRNQLVASYNADADDPDNNTVVDNYYQHCQTRHQTVPAMIKSSEDNMNSRTPALKLPDFEAIYPPPTPDKYTVAGGDTFTSVAERLFGDGSFGSQLAEYKGLTVGDNLQIGQILNIPQYYPQTNNSQNTKVYEEFVQLIVGTLYPRLNLKQPPPRHHKHHSSFWGEVFSIVLDVVAVFVGIEFGPEVLGPILGLSTVAGSVGATLSVVLATTVTTAIEQEIEIGMGLQDHFSLSKSVMEGLAAGIGYFNLPAGMPADFGNAMQALSKIAIEEQLAEFAAEGKKIDMREVISNIISGAIMFGVTPRVPLTAITEAEAAGRIALRDVESSLVSNIVEDALMRKPFDFESVAEQALGVTVADIGTNIVKSEIQIAKANQETQASAQKSYTEAQQNSVNSKNPGGNRFSMFGGNSNSNMDTSENMQDQQNTTKNKPNWLTASASDLLGNSGDNSMQDMDFDISLPSASNSLNSTQNPFGFWNAPNNNSLSLAQRMETGLLNSQWSNFLINPLNPAINASIAALGQYGINAMQRYVEEHGSLNMDLSLGLGVAFVGELNFSTKGLTVFKGWGAGFGFDYAMGGSYDFQSVKGLMSKTSINFSLGETPIQFGGSFIISQNGPAFSFDINPGIGIEVSTVLGKVKEYSWDEVENSLPRPGW